jgi:hypothetical protein
MRLYASFAGVVVLFAGCAGVSLRYVLTRSPRIVETDGEVRPTLDSLGGPGPLLGELESVYDTVYGRHAGRGNELMEADARRRLKRAFAAYEGRAVNWSVKLDRISPAGDRMASVGVKPYDGAGDRARSARLVVVPAPGDEPIAEEPVVVGWGGVLADGFLVPRGGWMTRFDTATQTVRLSGAIAAVRRDAFQPVFYVYLKQVAIEPE